MGNPELRFQRRYLQARYKAAALIYDKGAQLAHALSDRYPQIVRRVDNTEAAATPEWSVYNLADYRRLTIALMQMELNWEGQVEADAFARESERVATLIAQTLEIDSYFRLGLVQNILVPGLTLDDSRKLFIEKLYSDRLISGLAKLKPLSDVGMILDFRDEHWFGQIMFGPYNESSNAALFECADAPGLKGFSGGFIFRCDFWRQQVTFPPTEVSRFTKEANEHAIHAVENIMQILGGDSR